MVLEQPLSQDMPMPRPMPLPDTLLKAPDQSVPFQGYITPKPLGIRLPGTLSGYDNDIDDVKHPEVTDNPRRQCIENTRNCLMKFKMR